MANFQLVPTLQKAMAKALAKAQAASIYWAFFRAHCTPMKFVLRCLVLEIARGKGPRKRGGRNRNRGNQKSLDEEQDSDELFGLQIT